MIITKWIFAKDNLTQEQSDSWQKLQQESKHLSAGGSLSFAKNAHLLVKPNQFIYAYGYNKEKLLIILPLMKTSKVMLGTSYKCIQIISHNHLDCFIAVGQNELAPNDIISSLMNACRTQLSDWHLFLARRWLFENNIDTKYISPVYQRHAAFLNLSENKTTEQLIPKKLLKNVLRFEKRLSTEGKLNLHIAQDKNNVVSALEEFIRLEKLGWKGTKGSAIGCQETLSLFYHNCWSDFSNDNQARIFFLKIDEQIIAASIAFQFGSRLYLHKITYNEELSNNGPGSVLVKKIIEYAADEQTLTSLCFNTNPPWLDRWHPKLYNLRAVLFFNHNLKGLLLKMCFNINSNLRLLKRRLEKLKS